MKFFRDQTSRLFRIVPGKRHNLVIVALENYPSGLFKTSIGITLLAAPLLLNFFADVGVDSLAMRIVLNGLVIVIVPALILFIVTLLRAPKLRMKAEAAAAQELVAVSEGLEALKVQEQKDEDEVVRLKQEVSSNKDARRVKDRQEEQRWNSLNERLRAQEKTGQASIDLREERDVARQELAAEERILVAQRVKDLTDEREVARQELASGDLKAQKIKDLKDDGRWQLLNERMRMQEESMQLNQDQKDGRDERRAEREELRAEREGEKDEREEQRDERELQRFERESLRSERETQRDEREELRAEREGEKQEREEMRDERELQRFERESLRSEREAQRDEREDKRDEREGAKEEREVARQELTASVDLKAQQVKDLKEDKRWDLLNEDMRKRGVAAGKRDESDKEEREFVREQLATAVLKAQQDSEDRNKEQEIRGMDQWNMLHERLRIQEEKSQQREEESARRERDQQRRDDEVYLMRLADQLRDQYKNLLDRYIRYADKNGLPDDVANGIAPIPDDWLKQQPELKRDPSLFDSLVAYNERT